MTTPSDPILAALVARVEAAAEHFEAALKWSEKLALERDRRYEAQFNAQKEAVVAALAAAEVATSKAETTQNARLEGMNEFREAMKDQAGKFLTRKEAWGFLFGAAGLIAAIVTALLQLAGG